MAIILYKAAGLLGIKSNVVSKTIILQGHLRLLEPGQLPDNLMMKALQMGHGRLEREHPYVEYAGDFKGEILDSLKARLPKFSKWDSINAGTGRVRVSIYVNQNGIVTIEDSPDYSSSPKKTRVIVEAARRIASEKSGSLMWIPGAHGKRLIPLISEDKPTKMPVVSVEEERG